MNNATQSFLGRYRLVKVLGQGAMGVVYEAVDTRLNRTVAIKTVLRSHLADETTAKEYATRFEREAQAAARLAHPNVVTVYDFGEHEDISYIVMEFVRGRELNQAFEAGEPFTLPEVIRIMRELLAALDYAHQQGIVHRDIKPANVMLDHAGHVKLTDFGVARIVNANQDRTMPGTLVGTPSYMSPEQILGLAVGSRADIFAAGVILYQFLTGKRPFSGGGPFGVQRKIVQDDPEPPSVANPQLPSGFDLIIARALAKQPEDRYETAAAFAHDLERIGASLPRDLPHIDLDFSDAPPPPTVAAPTTTPAPAPPAPPAPSGLTLKTDLQPGPVPAAPAAAGSAHRPPPDPEATVIMSRTSTPEVPAAQVSRRPPAPPPLPPTAEPAAPRSPAATAAPRPATASPAPSPAIAPGTPGARAARAPVAPKPMSPARPTAASGASRRTLLPLAAGAGVAVLALAIWLLMGKPTRTPAEAEAPSVTSQPSPAAAPAALPLPGVTPAAPGFTATDPGRPAASPAVVEPAVMPAATPASTPAPAAAPTPPAKPAPTPALAPTPSPAAEATTPEPGRRPATERAPRSTAVTPAVRPPAPERSEPRGALEPRCSDLLQRMQLGEPLTPDQTQYFQTRCTR